MSTVVIFLVVIIFLVVAHELGHFFVAKSFGVRVDEFGLGYPPRAGKLFRWKGTQFTLNWLPFGGFVKIFGEDSGGELQPDSFAYQKKWKRALILLAGILANFVLAMILYAISFGVGFFGTASDFPGSIVLGPNQNIITDVLPKSPASSAGITTGDIIAKLSVGGDVLIPEDNTAVSTFIQSHSNDAITFSLVRGTTARDVIVTPKAGLIDDKPGIGIGFQVVAPLRLPFWRAVKEGCTYTFAMFGSIVHTLGSLIKGAFTKDTTLLSQISGPVGIATYAGQAFTLGLGTFLSFVAIISVNLSVINLFPFPALDGGRLVIELFTSKGRSKIPPKVIGAVNQIGFIILILFMLFITYRDIVKLFV